MISTFGFCYIDLFALVGGGFVGWFCCDGLLGWVGCVCWASLEVCWLLDDLGYYLGWVYWAGLLTGFIPPPKRRSSISF